MLDARAFIEKAVVWPSPEQEGYISLHTSDNWTGVAVRTVDEFMKELADARERETDVYFCLGRQIKLKKAKANGATHMVPIRKGFNTDQYKGVWVDWDAGPDKQFKTSAEAMEGLKKFLADSGMPVPSAIVASGSGGFHLHWWSDRPLIKGVWEQYARALKALLERHGFEGDVGCTTDAVRILRVPGTVNCKHKPPKPVSLLGMGEEYDFSVALAFMALNAADAPRRGLAPLPSGGLPVPARFKGRTDIIAVDEKDVGGFAPMTAAQLRACLDLIPNDKPGWERWNTVGMRVYAACDGADYGQTEWQRWSDTLALEVEKDSCEDRWNTYHTSPPTRTGGGALINQVRNIVDDPKWFPLREDVKLPAVKEEEDPSDLHLPPRFRLKDRRIEIEILPKKKKKQGDDDDDDEEDPEDRWRPFIRSEIVSQPWAQDNPSGIHFTIRTDIKRTRDVFIPRTDFTRTKICLRMHTEDIWFNAKIQPVEYEEFFMSWIGRMNSYKAANSKSAFGWEWGEDTKIPNAFVYGGYRFKADGTKEHVGAADEGVRAVYYPKGERGPWDQAAKLIFGQKRPGLEIIVAAAMAGPLMQATGLDGAMLSVYSTSSGAHKSTASKLGAAIFGHPKNSRETHGTSAKGALKRAGDVRNLTIQFDDLQEEKDLRTAILVGMQLAQGHEGTKLKQNREYASSGEWQTLALTLSNQSVVQYVVTKEPNTAAQLNRVFEIYHTKQPDEFEGMMDEGDVNRLMDNLNRNYGQVGLEYAQLLAVNAKEIRDIVEQEMKDFRKAIAERGVNKDSANRFWVATCTILLAAAKIGVEIGIPFSYEPMKEMLVEAFVDNDTKRGEETVEGESAPNAEAALTEYLNKACPRYGLWSRTAAKKGGAKGDKIEPIGTPPNQQREIHVHLITGLRVIRIVRSEFKKALAEEKRNIDTVVRGLVKHFNADAKSRYSLGAGSEYLRGQERTIEIPVPEGSPWEGLLFAHGGRTDEQI